MGTPTEEGRASEALTRISAARAAVPGAKEDAKTAAETRAAIERENQPELRRGVIPQSIHPVTQDVTPLPGPL
jgi:hypothetical protein